MVESMTLAFGFCEGATILVVAVFTVFSVMDMMGQMEGTWI